MPPYNQLSLLLRFFGNNHFFTFLDSFYHGNAAFIATQASLNLAILWLSLSIKDAQALFACGAVCAHGARRNNECLLNARGVDGDVGGHARLQFHLLFWCRDDLNA